MESVEICKQEKGIGGARTMISVKLFHFSFLFLVSSVSSGRTFACKEVQCDIRSFTRGGPSRILHSLAQGTRRIILVTLTTIPNFLSTVCPQRMSVERRARAMPMKGQFESVSTVERGMGSYACRKVSAVTIPCDPRHGG